MTQRNNEIGLSDMHDEIVKRLGKPGWLRLPDRAYLVAAGQPPTASQLRDAVIEKRAGVQIRDLDPEYSDLEWLKPVIREISDILITWPEGEVDLTVLEGANALKRLVVGSALASPVDLSKFTQLHVLDILWMSGRYQNLDSLENLKELSIDRPPADLRFLRQMLQLESLDLSGARRLSAIPEASEAAGIRRLAIHGATTLDTSAISSYTALRRLFLHTVKHLTHSAGLRKCESLSELLAENCGPQIDVEVVKVLVESFKLRRIDLVGPRIPFTKEEILELAQDIRFRDYIVAPPRFLPKELRNPSTY